jgi:hypothetical protein
MQTDYHDLLYYEFLIGMRIEEASKDLTNCRIPWRITASEGYPAMLTCDFNPVRVNLEVKNGIVTRVKFG